ncbi:hypothetical protein DMH04_25540 [Kibdelosporangium aridum]|uniref:Uncharacterized protein n=1 Tax=Kibdelosporangium aridum TaxID=2030 RepID=A0A428Z695_KIBAR|nr:hypothetical protein DMH04_25540 [Kibdelosporangium aridum]
MVLLLVGGAGLGIGVLFAAIISVDIINRLRLRWSAYRGVLAADLAALREWTSMARAHWRQTTAILDEADRRGSRP